MKITVIDYGLSNLLSVRRAFEYFGAEVEITGSRSRILSAKALVLPGVGAAWRASPVFLWRMPSPINAL